MAAVIKYSDVSSVFRLRNGFLYPIITRAGRKPGSCKPKNYAMTCVNNQAHMTHRIVYCLKIKRDLPGNIDVDHIDNDKHNNNAYNLRAASHRHNCYNTGMRTNNKTGIKGLSVLARPKQATRYRAQLWAGEKRLQKLFPYTRSGRRAAKEWLDTQRIINHGEYARFK